MNTYRTTIRSSLICSSLIILSACTPHDPHRDYDASAQCIGMGHVAGTPAYDQCISEEQKARMLEEQRKEFDERKADEEYWRMHRY